MEIENDEYRKKKINKLERIQEQKKRLSLLRERLHHQNFNDQCHTNDKTNKDGNKKRKQKEKRQIIVSSISLPSSFYEIYPNLKSLPQGRFEKKDEIEKKIEKAVIEKDFQHAETLNQKLIQKRLTERQVDEEECLDFQEKLRKEKKMEERKRQRKKKIIWGMDQKPRWEQKNNK